MTIEELALICRAHEGIQAGGRNSQFINPAYKLISNKKVTKNQKILAINKYFDTVSNEVLAELLIGKYEKEGKFSGETQNKG